MATVTVEEGQVTVFVAVDHCTTESIGIDAAKRATQFEALEPVRQAVREYNAGDERLCTRLEGKDGPQPGSKQSQLLER